MAVPIQHAGAAGLMGWGQPTHVHSQLRALPRIMAQQSWHARCPWKFDVAGTNILDSTLIRSHEGFMTMTIKIRSRSRDRSLPRETASALKDQGKQLQWWTRRSILVRDSNSLRASRNPAFLRNLLSGSPGHVPTGASDTKFPRARPAPRLISSHQSSTARTMLPPSLPSEIQALPGTLSALQHCA